MEGICGRELRVLGQIDPEPIDWLWEPYLACGTLALLSGEAGSGTTFMALALAAAITRRMERKERSPSEASDRQNTVSGRCALSDEVSQSETRNEDRATSSWTPSVAPGRVLYFSLENYAGRVIRPRMEALGAASNHMAVGAGYRPLSDFALTVRELSPRLVILDTLQTFAQLWRREAWLDELRRLAAECNCCLLLVRHIRRARSGRVPARRIGNFDLSSALASELLVGIEGAPEGTLRRMVPVRSALGPLGAPLGFEITASQGFRWLGPVEGGLAELVAAPKPPPGPSALARATEFLNGALAFGPMEYERVQQLARSAGISKATLQRAKTSLQVLCRKATGTGHWIWALASLDSTPVDPERVASRESRVANCEQPAGSLQSQGIALDAKDAMVEKDGLVDHAVQRETQNVKRETTSPVASQDGNAVIGAKDERVEKDVLGDHGLQRETTVPSPPKPHAVIDAYRSLAAGLRSPPEVIPFGREPCRHGLESLEP
jgi:hypothetical protein